MPSSVNSSSTNYVHASGTVTTKSTGKVGVRTFPSSGAFQAGIERTQHQDGTNTGGKVTLTETTFSTSGTKSWTDGTNTVQVTRLLPDTSKRYRSSSVQDTTSYTRTFYSGAAAWTAKKTTTTLPSLESGDTSGPATVTLETYSDAKGRTVFSKDGAGVLTYFKYDSFGRMVKRISDPTSGAGSDSDATGAATTHSVTLNASGLNYTTTYTYDDQGRMLTSTGPTGRTSANHYTQLADGRMVTLSVGYQSGTTSRGPASYTVTNAAGKVEAQGVIGLTGDVTTTAMSSWINTASSDVIGAVSSGIGSVKQLTVNIYDLSGSHLQSSRLFNTIPSTYAGATASEYEVTSYGYDNLGRTRRVVDPTGTISYTVFDEFGRPTERWAGTDDTGFAGGMTGGTSNMTKLETTTYDAGSVGNSLITSRTVHVDSTSGNDRITTYVYDWRDRLIVQKNPQAPHNVFAYNDAGQTVGVAGYSDHTGLSASSVPTGTSNRVSYAETIYNSRGQVRESLRHAITQSSGASATTLSSYQWYDGAGREIKSRGEQLTKTKFDALGRATNSFVLAKDNDGSTHADATDVAGDTVMEERQNFYDDTSSRKGLVLMSVAISRHPGDTTTTGALDNVGDGNGVVNTGSSSFKGRAQITSYYYDANLDRQTDVVFLGTNGGTTYTRTSDTSVGSRSNDRLITSTTYTTDGLTDMTTDARGIVTKTTYDAARRTQTTIHNFVDGTPGGGTDGDEDQTIEYTYTNGLMTAQKADLPGTSDQTTTYTYDVVSTGTLPSTITSKRLLRKVAYPDSGGSTDVVLYAYNRQGQQTGMIDQAGNQVDTTYDTAGRETKRTVSTLASGFDGSVRRIEMAYLSRGMIDTVTQYDAVSSGNATDQVLYKYDDWGNLEWLYQDVDSTMNSSGVSSGDRPSFSIKYESSKKAPSGGVQLISRDYRRSYAGTGGTTQFAAVQYDYGTSGGIDDTMGRVRSVKASLDGTTFTTVATYDYLGAGQLVGTTLNQPNLETKLTSGTGTSTTYPDMDRFGRPTKWDWWRSGGAAFYDVDIAHDENSNPTSTTDNVHVRNSSGNRIFDVLYGLDKLNRVTSADEGELASGSISNRTSKETWALSHTGNWNTNTRDLDGNGTNDLNFSGTFNDANEWTSRTDSVAPFTENMTYDANGNMTSWGYREGDANKYTYVYDGFGRLKKVQTDISGSPWDHAVYRYNGLGYRIQWQYDENINFTLSSSERFYFLYDDRWRIVATFRDTDSSAKESFVYHAAGVAGRGGSSYIDSVILRDKDANTGWTSAADGALEDRVFYAQNWRADVVAITKSDGQPTEFIRYTSYGTAQAFAAADVNRDGTVNSTDVTDWDNLFSEASSGAAIPVDFDFDGSSFNPDDNDAFTAAYNEASGWTNGGLGAGGGKLSRIGNRKGYAGYEYDHSVVAYHVRHRVYVPEIGRWTKRDPLGYVDGMSVYEYVGAMIVRAVDRSGTLKYCLDCIGMPICGCGNAGATDDSIDVIPDDGPVDGDLESCCSKAKRDPTLDPGSLGVTLCCGTSITTCMFPDRLPGAEDNPGRGIVDDCARSHERTHRDQFRNTNACSSCPDVPGMGKRNPCNPIDPDSNKGACAECEGYAQELLCLLEKYNSCGANEACRSTVGSRMERVNQNMASYCSRCNQPLDWPNVYPGYLTGEM